MEPISKVAIVGYGLIGGSIGHALRARSPQVAVTALDVGDDLSRVAGAELVILAAPIAENSRVLPELARRAGDAILTDTGSTKASTVAAAEAVDPRLRFIGGHPVAGAATGGVEAASADLFAGRPWILTPTSRTRLEDLDRLKGFVESLGATVHMMDAVSHDRLFAYISHLPQLTISALMHVVGQSVGEAGLQFAGGGLRDSTRIASSPAAIWRDVVGSNTRNVNAALDALIEALLHLRDRGDEAVPRIFADAARWKERLQKGDPE